ncbi:hypothetical protein PSPO01_04441 [Paraphaeosphaeria sporulosa]
MRQARQKRMQSQKRRDQSRGTATRWSQGGGFAPELGIQSRCAGRLVGDGRMGRDNTQAPRTSSKHSISRAGWEEAAMCPCAETWRRPTWAHRSAVVFARPWRARATRDSRKYSTFAMRRPIVRSHVWWVGGSRDSQARIGGGRRPCDVCSVWADGAPG